MEPFSRRVWELDKAVKLLGFSIIFGLVNAVAFPSLLPLSLVVLEFAFGNIYKDSANLTATLAENPAFW